jgi:hypothetical protein
MDKSIPVNLERFMNRTYLDTMNKSSPVNLERFMNRTYLDSKKYKVNDLLPVNETPKEIINSILDLVIDMKIENLDFDVLIMLLKYGHNKKVVRTLALDLCYTIDYNIDFNINFLDKDSAIKCCSFIIDLIKIDELGLAKVFYDLLKRYNNTWEKHYDPDYDSTDSDDSDYDPDYAWEKHYDPDYDSKPIDLNRDLDISLIEACLDNEKFVESLFKIGVDEENLYNFSLGKHEEKFIKAGIKMKKFDYLMFFIHDDKYKHTDLYLKYESIVKDIIGSERLHQLY